MEFIDLKAQYNHFKIQIDASILKVLSEGQFIMGPQVDEFEKKLAAYVGVKHAISCSDGTSALQLAYMAYKIGKGDAVFCPDMTFIASVEPACLLGATPVFCDIDELTYNIDPQSLERQIISVIKEGKLKPRAVVAVDFLGNPADYEAIRKITDKYGLLLIEDAAQSIGASYKGIKCGNLGDISTTSFFPSKPLGCYGDGGAVFTNDDRIADIVYSLRMHGRGTSKYDNVRIGINSRLDTLQAAVLSIKLEELPAEIQKRQKIAKLYNAALQKKYHVPYIKEHNISSYAQYVLITKNKLERSIVLDRLEKEKIPSIIYYPNPLHMLPLFKNTNYYGEHFYNSIQYCSYSFALPFSPYLLFDEQKHIINVLNNIF